ncbi:CMRF35-like molecule 1 [Danio aesculapii]|uniref:CMRF35-like molecule 1 n=1 Tax=Danio aesculapii TaxID=1142201 RepID=UPI0024C0E614|nr:CMRF35-like molecule 1 [Danio aesculapii]
MITCSHKWASDNFKYFCRDPCTYKDGALVSSIQALIGRYRLKDLGNGSFTVTITDLQESDSGIYWCGVNRSIKDTYEKVILEVSKDPNESIATSTQAYTDMDTFMGLLHTTNTQAAPSSESPSTKASSACGYSSLDTITFPPSVSASVHTSQYAAGGLGLAVIILLVGLITVHQYRKRVKTSETATSADRSDEFKKEDIQNSTEIKSTDTYEVMRSHSYSIYENLDQGQVNEAY